MARALEAPTLKMYARELARTAHNEHGVPEQLADRARTATVRNLAHLGNDVLGSSGRRRVKAYFDAVVRRASARATGPGVREYRLKVMAASVAADLRASGADGERISDEVDAWLKSHQGAA